MRDSILMYKSHCDALEALPPEQFKAAVTAIWKYGMEDIEPEGDPVTVAMVGMVRPLIDKNNKRYENGRKGGRPENQAETKRNQNGESNNQNAEHENQNGESDNLKEKGERRKVKGETKKDILSAEPTEYPYKAVIDYLNEKAGTGYKDKSKDTRRHIKARFDEGYKLEDFIRVIDGRTAAWKDDPKMSEFLRPSTLFGSKFESYLNAKPAKAKPKNSFNNFTQRQYDYDALEQALTGRRPKDG